MSLPFSEANVLAARKARRSPFTHMAPGDVRVWVRILELDLMPADKYEYDIRLGGTRAHEIEPGHELAPMWETLLKKRVDVVAWRGLVPWLVEVKPIASFSALGQAVGYADLWRKERGGKVPPVVSVCCALVDEDLRPTFERLGVHLVSLPASYAEQVLMPAGPAHGAGTR